MPKQRRDPANPDYGEYKIEGPGFLELKCEECGENDSWTVVEKSEDSDRADVFAQMALRLQAEREGWKVHVHWILCPKCHLERMIARNFEPEKLTDDPRYVDLTDPNFVPGDWRKRS